ncbi:hypothetical protein KFE25_000175 [Diacronema lutheri]|uniref:LIM zinc-binding domain-containing protein n=1 Tax=Diacronema lutheri TaxID=2081491 RepID=A0A8J5XHD2_DIALT|nr:hypothetical protein KFE25_000175 [Diacronema lutheri]
MASGRPPPLERCAKCGLETYGASVVHAEGRRFHEHCFRCERCESPFADGTFHPVGGQLLCADCRDAHIGPWCEKCGGSLAAKERLIAQNKVWHPACFCCSSCGQQIDATYREHGGDAMCERCYDDRLATRCAGCRKVVADDSGIIAEGEAWHAACFVCVACGLQLVDPAAERARTPDDGAPADAGGDPASSSRAPGAGEEGCDYYVLGGKPFCRAHYLDQCMPLCAACLQPADAEPIAALGAVYHRACLVCAHCRVAVGGSAFIDHDGSPYCQADYYALFGGRATDRRAPPERSHAFLLRLRTDALRTFSGRHAELWHEVRRELREEGVRNAQAHVFADGTLLFTLALDEARDVQAALTAIFEKSAACGEWAQLLRSHAPHELAERHWLFEAAADPLELASGAAPRPEEVDAPMKRSAAHQRMRPSASAPVGSLPFAPVGAAR